MADDPEHLEAHAGADLAGEGALSFTTLPLGEVDELLDFLLWDMPEHMVPSPERACRTPSGGLRSIQHARLL